MVAPFKNDRVSPEYTNDVFKAMLAEVRRTLKDDRESKAQTLGGEVKDGTFYVTIEIEGTIPRKYFQRIDDHG